MTTPSNDRTLPIPFSMLCAQWAQFFWKWSTVKIVILEGECMMPEVEWIVSVHSIPEVVWIVSISAGSGLHVERRFRKLTSWRALAAEVECIVNTDSRRSLAPEVACKMSTGSGSVHLQTELWWGVRECGVSPPSHLSLFTFTQPLTIPIYSVYSKCVMKRPTGSVSASKDHVMN
jgi:hypothetical protein